MDRGERRAVNARIRARLIRALERDLVKLDGEFRPISPRERHRLRRRILRDCLIAGKLTLTQGETISVSVEKAPGQKCARSWFVREDVGADPEHPTLSASQAAIIRELVRRGAVTADA